MKPFRLKIDGNEITGLVEISRKDLRALGRRGRIDADVLIVFVKDGVCLRAKVTSTPKRGSGGKPSR